MQSAPHSSAQYATGPGAMPLFHAAWLFAAGILLASRLWLRPGIVLVVLGAVAALCILAAFKAQRIAWFPLAVLWILLGAWCAEVEPHPAPSAQLLALSDGLLRTVEGTVLNTGTVHTQPDPYADEPSGVTPLQSIDLRLASAEVVTDETDAQAPVDGGLRLTVRWPDDANAAEIQPFDCGERVRAVVRLLPPAAYHDPGVWSHADYLLGQGITTSASVKIDRIERLGRAPGSFWSCRISGWQHATAEKLMALPASMQKLPPALRLSHDDAIMLSAMVAGDRTFLTHTLREGFERTGSFHMLVVSGFHLAIVAGCIFWIARRLRLPRVPATFVTLLASLGYALFTGFATPVQRSLLMVTLYMLGRLIYRERNPLNTIGFASLCLMAASPRSLLDSSLQMTLLAVVSIAGVAAPLLQATVHPYLTAMRDLQRIDLDPHLAPPLAAFRVLMRLLADKLQQAANRWIAWRAFPWLARFVIRVVELVVISCIVELAMTMPMAVYFHRITIFALPVNLLILPLLSILLPAALVMLLLLLIWPAAAPFAAAVVAVMLHAGIGLVHLFGSIAMGDFRIPAPLPWQSIAFCILLGTAILLAWTGLQPSRRWHRRAAWAAMALAAWAAVVPRPVEHPRDAMLVEAIDVGQGDSLLLITPDGKTLLVDGGGFGGRYGDGSRQVAQNFDIGEEVVSPALWARGIRHLDAVALSHAHSDHMGGLPAVLRNFHPDELWVGNNPPAADYQSLLDEASSLHVRVRSFRSGDAFGFGSAQVNVLAPFRGYQPGSEPENNDSMVLHVAYKATSVLLTGDAEEPAEDAMLAQAALPGHSLSSTLLKVGHHGSTTSTQPEFLARVAPQWAVISCGLHNTYGHPRVEVLDELQASHVRTSRTDLNGISCFQLDGRSAAIDFNCMKPAER